MTQKIALSQADKDLVDLMYEIYYGSIENLSIRGGQPVLHPAPRILRDVRLGRRESKRPVRSRQDFTLKAQHIDLLQQFKELGDGIIVRIDVQAGLPFRIRVAAAA